jgi:hypothetical protein
MGLETACRCDLNGMPLEAFAHLDSAALHIVARNVSVSIPLDTVSEVEAKRGRLLLSWPSGSAVLDLGSAAETWALKIRYPRSRLDKLGVKPGAAVSLVNLADAAFAQEVRTRTDRVSSGRVRKQSDLIVVAAHAKVDLDELTSLRASIVPDGAIWVVWKKGQKALREDDVRAAAKAQGLVDVKVMSFSDELSALKLVIPRTDRKRGAVEGRGREPRSGAKRSAVETGDHARRAPR